MKAQTIFKSIYMVLTLALIFGFTFDAGNSNMMLRRNDAQLLLNQGGKKWVAPSMADKLTNPLKGNKEATEKGKSLFQTNCFTCHGQEGHGDGPGAAALHPKPANLASKAVQKQTDGAIYYKITTGFPPTAMISWRSNLSEKQRWELVNYIRELGKK